MDSSRRAVESYMRSRMIDGVTSDEDKVAPVYKLEEICELLRSSHAGIVKEVSEFILKRLDHKSPIVKQKALRLIKYSVGKSGVEFKREMQKHSSAIRQLFHYKGQLDPLKGDALNNAVRDTAHETITAIFASEDNKPVYTGDINNRIQGFGNTNFEMPIEDKKSFLSEVVDLGSASIRLGLSAVTSSHSQGKNNYESYKGPNLQRSLTKETNRPEREFLSRQSWNSSGPSKNVSGGLWGQESKLSTTETTNIELERGHAGGKSREERLLDTIVTSGGVRLQPTRDAIQVFIKEASKVDSMALCQALEFKLQSPLWQVRMKAVCLLEAILRKKDDAHLSTIASYFCENQDAVVKCSETPQVSLSEKANKVLSLLNEDQTARDINPFTAKVETTTAVEIPNLIDTGNPDDYQSEGSSQKQIDENVANLTSAKLVVDDLFGDSHVTSTSKNEDDPFADVSFHTTEDRKQDIDDLFSGLAVDSKKQAGEDSLPTYSSDGRPDLFNVFDMDSEQPLKESATISRGDLNRLMTGLSLDASLPTQGKQQGPSGGAFSGATFMDPRVQLNSPSSVNTLNGIFGSQTVSVNTSPPNPLFPLGTMQYSIPPNCMINPAFASQQLNYNAMGSFFSQQQLLATMSNFQNLGNHGPHGNSGLGLSTGNGMEGVHTSPLPDIFHLTNSPLQNHNTSMSTKKDETRAFDFISDHLSSARDPKKVV